MGVTSGRVDLRGAEEKAGVKIAPSSYYAAKSRPPSALAVLPKIDDLDVPGASASKNVGGHLYGSGHPLTLKVNPMFSRPDPHLHGKDPSASPGEVSYPVLCHLLDTAVVIETLWQTRVRPRLRTQISSALGLSDEAACRVLMLVAAVHDIGKANPFFQFQQRNGAASDFAADLQAVLGLPPTPEPMCSLMNAQSDHPLRRHEFLSHHAVAHAWAARESEVASCEWVAMLAGGHHGYWRDPVVNDGWVGEGVGDRLLQGGWAEQQDYLLARVEESLDLTVGDVPPLSGPHASIVFICFSGLLTLADWIASDDLRVSDGKARYLAVRGTDVDPYLSGAGGTAWLDGRRTEFQEHVDLCLGEPAEVTTAALHSAVLGDYQPRPLQAEACDLLAPGEEHGLWICMYPTGDGKTEAALLRGALDAEEGFFFGLPTLATTDSMEDRLRGIGDRLAEAGHSLPLVKSHQFAWLDREEPPQAGDHSDDECCDQANPAWYSSSIRKLVAPNVVGTVDQALAGALAQRHITLRLFGLANHHVILDEIHTFDVYQTELLIELLHWWGATATRVTLLSATLPRTHMRRMAQAYRAGALGLTTSEPSDYDKRVPLDMEVPFPSTVFVSALPDTDSPIIVREPQGEVRRPPNTRVDLLMAPDRAARVNEHIEWARRTAATHPDSPIAIVTNVIGDCQAVAKVLADDPDITHEVICLHSAMLSSHRLAAESHLIHRAGKQAHTLGFDASSTNRRPVIVVGTQVIQASLDFDVDFMSTDLAPAPDLLQRWGRQWRFEDLKDNAGARGGRLGAAPVRAIQVVSVGKLTDGKEVLERRAAMPYLTAVLRRTHGRLREYVTTAPDQVIDVFGLSQEWVDTAYDADPLDLLSEDEAEVAEAVREGLDAAEKKRAAAVSRAAIGRRGDLGTRPLLARSTGKRRGGARWGDLAKLTELPDDNDLMRTRYIEVESMTVLLFDTTGSSFYLRPGSGEEVALREHLGPEQLVNLAVPQALPHFVSWRCTIPFGLHHDAERAIDLTLGSRKWRPQAMFLTSTRPLDLRHLAGIATYDPVAGLMKTTRRETR